MLRLAYAAMFQAGLAVLALTVYPTVFRDLSRDVERKAAMETKRQAVLRDLAKQPDDPRDVL